MFLEEIEKLLQLLISFQKVLDESNHKPNKISVDKGSGLCNRSQES